MRDRRFHLAFLVEPGRGYSHLLLELVDRLQKRLVLGLLEDVRLKRHNFAVLEGVADLDGMAAYLAILDVSLTLHRGIEDHRDLLPAVGTREEVLHMTCKKCKTPMKELKGHIYHKKRKWKCPNCGRARMQTQK